jgi:MoaD family protein
MPLVKLYANLRKLAGTKELSITGTTVAAVVSKLARRNPPVGEIILQNGEWAPYIVLTVNGHNIIELATLLREQDTVEMFPPIADD